MKGILFKPDMIKAIVEGRKTQTRRAIKPQPKVIHSQYTDSSIETEQLFRNGRKTLKPRYQVGETVYIKEAWQVLDVDTRTLREPIHHVKIEHRIDGVVRWTHMPATIAYTIPDAWHSPLHLAEITARYFIQITDARAERLQNMTEKDALEEGINIKAVTTQGNLVIDVPSYVNAYAMLWDFINPNYPWESNPWVWPYRFKLNENHSL